MANAWFRMYAEVLNDPKVQALSPDLFKAWVNILCIACKNNGTLPGTLPETAFLLRMSENDAISVIDRLSNAGLIDKVNGGKIGYRIAPHGWDERQYKSDSSNDRVKRYREQKRNVTVTPPDTDTDTDTDKKDIGTFALKSEPENKPENLKSKKGSRLPIDWTLPQEWGDWAETQGLTGQEIIFQSEKFKDWWISKSGAGGIKADWQATWRNWIRTYFERKSNDLQTKRYK